LYREEVAHVDGRAVSAETWSRGWRRSSTGLWSPSRWGARWARCRACSEPRPLNAAGAVLGGGSPRLSGATRGRVRQKGGKDVRLPQSFAVAVTPTSVYFFKWKPFWGRVKIKGEARVSVAPPGWSSRSHRAKASTAFLLVFTLRREPAPAFELGTLGFASAKARVGRDGRRAGP